MTSRPVYKCDKYSMEVVESYPSVYEAARATGDDRSCIYASCAHRNVGWQGFVWRFADDYDPNETFEGKANRPVYVYDTVTKAVAVFETLSVAAKKTGVSYRTLTTAMEHGYRARKRFVVKYAR